MHLKPLFQFVITQFMYKLAYKTGTARKAQSYTILQYKKADCDVNYLSNPIKIELKQQIEEI